MEIVNGQIESSLRIVSEMTSSSVFLSCEPPPTASHVTLYRSSRLDHGVQEIAHRRRLNTTTMDGLHGLCHINASFLISAVLRRSGMLHPVHDP